MGPFSRLQQKHFKIIAQDSKKDAKKSNRKKKFPFASTANVCFFARLVSENLLISDSGHLCLVFSVFKMAAENGEDPGDEVVRILRKGELFSGLLVTPRGNVISPKYINIIYEFGLVRQKHEV